jgi:hypothetical protein
LGFRDVRLCGTPLRRRAGDWTDLLRILESWSATPKPLKNLSRFTTPYCPTGVNHLMDAMVLLELV